MSAAFAAPGRPAERRVCESLPGGGHRPLRNGAHAGADRPGVRRSRGTAGAAAGVPGHTTPRRLTDAQIAVPGGSRCLTAEQRQYQPADQASMSNHYQQVELLDRPLRNYDHARADRPDAQIAALAQPVQLLESQRIDSFRTDRRAGGVPGGAGRPPRSRCQADRQNAEYAESTTSEMTPTPQDRRPGRSRSSRCLR